MHLLLIDLTVENAFVRVLHLILVHALLLDLLGSLRATHLFSHLLRLFDLFLLLLLLQREIGHMLRVDVCLLVESCALGCEVALLVGVPGVVFELRHGGKVAAGLGGFEIHPSCGHISCILSHQWRRTATLNIHI